MKFYPSIWPNRSTRVTLVFTKTLLSPSFLGLSTISSYWPGYNVRNFYLFLRYSMSYTQRSPSIFPVYILKEGSRGLSLHRNDCWTWRLNILTCYYINTTKFWHSNTIKRYRRYLFIILIHRETPLYVFVELGL